MKIGKKIAIVECKHQFKNNQNNNENLRCKMYQDQNCCAQYYFEGIGLQCISNGGRVMQDAEKYCKHFIATAKIIEVE